MATPLTLAQQHRRAQAALKAALEAYLKRTYLSMISPRDTRRLAEQWVALMLPYVLTYRARSAGLAATTYRSSRELVLPGVPFFEPEPDDFDEEALRTSLFVTGFADLLERVGKGEPFEEAVTASATAAAGAGVRHALNGGRSYYERAIRADRLALAWYRVTKPGCCYFCAMLASRGAVYREDSFAESDPRFIGDEGEEKVHDHCVCTLQAIWRRGDDTPELNQQFSALWESSTRGYSGQEAVKAFRRAYEAAYPPAA